ncbi:sensor histidine kinase [Vreelandella nigrificans]|uniref:histidine kinase n=1 Tax=Vreelandella nigrificans TaxID=2042704 RepID=A0A2A4HKP7_9GAMM|nr:ATP-binding protein [Halomonas nigrificans]PCF95492.1 two-component sensor histidine kinase [Halomonas nigrificans]
MSTAKKGRSRQLWYWISLRMIGLALMAILVVGAGMWLRFFWWETKLRNALPKEILQELKLLETDHVANAERLREIYGQYLYGDYFTPEVLHADLLWFSGLVLIALPLIIGGGIWVSLRLSRQLSVVAIAARHIAGGDFRSRASIIPDAPAALHHLIADFNHMAERLERHERELQASSAAIAHELRTPLTAAKGRLQGLIDGVFEASPQQLSTIMRQLDQLNRLIDDLYLLSLATAGQLVLIPSSFALKPLMEERVVWAAPRLQQHPMKIVIDCPDDVLLNADRDRLGQVVSILIDNALRYAATGDYLALRATRQGTKVLIDVEDAGPGFAPEHIERVCDRFWRAEHSRSRHAGGSGLGLSVAVAICQAHGGQLSVHNRGTGGGRIHIELPA